MSPTARNLVRDPLKFRSLNFMECRKFAAVLSISFSSKLFSLVRCLANNLSVSYKPRESTTIFHKYLMTDLIF